MDSWGGTVAGRWAWLLLLVLAGGGCGEGKDAGALVAEARQYHQKGDDKAAIIQLKNALQKDPDAVQARYLLGTIYNRTGDLQSAEKELRRALDLGMPAAEVLPELGRTLLDLGQLQKVLDETDALFAAQSSAGIAALRGNALLGLGKFEEAQDLFQQALTHNPDFPEALIGLAKYSLSQGDLEAAERFSEQAVSQNPENADAWHFKGDLLRAQNKAEPALAAYKQVARLKPNSSSAYVNQALIEIGTGKFEAAQADLETARKVAPGSLIVFYTQALLDYNQGRHAAALDSLQQILSKAPDHMPSVLLSGAVQLALDSTPQAEQHLKHYLQNEPDNVYARKLMALILLKSNQPRRAADVLLPALKMAPHDSQLFALAGESSLQAKDFAKATEYFEQASSIAPENAMLHTALSMSKMGQGDSARAVTELERATELDPESSQAGILLVMTHLRLKEFDKALAAAKAIEKKAPDSPLVHNLKGGVYLGRKEMASARASFEKAVSLQPGYFPAIMNLAQLDLQEKKPAAARKRLEAVLEKDRKNIQAMNALSRLAFSQGQDKEGAAWLERAHQENPDALQPAVALATHYLRSGEENKALALAQTMQATHTRNPDALDMLAQAQFATGDQAGALETYQKLATMPPPASALAQFRIASIHTTTQNLDGASKALGKALSIKPDYLEAQLAQARLEAHRGDHERALAISREIQKQHEKSPAGYIAEGDLFMMQQNPALAVDAYEQALALGRTQSLLIKLHAALSQTGKSAQANRRLRDWVNENPDDASLRMYLAETYLKSSQYRDAIEHYQIILRQNPGFVPALNNVATAYQKEKDPRALEYAEKAHQLAPDSPAILDTLGWILVEQKNIARGLPLLKKAVSLAPAAAEIRYHLVLALLESGDKTQARSELKQLLASGTPFSDIEQAKLLMNQIR